VSPLLLQEASSPGSKAGRQRELANVGKARGGHSCQETLWTPTGPTVQLCPLRETGASYSLCGLREAGPGRRWAPSHELSAVGLHFKPGHMSHPPLGLFLPLPPAGMTHLREAGHVWWFGVWLLQMFPLGKGRTICLLGHYCHLLLPPLWFSLLSFCSPWQIHTASPLKLSYTQALILPTHTLGQPGLDSSPLTAP
jgi:hypothetical protein